MLFACAVSLAPLVLGQVTVHVTDNALNTPINRAEVSIITGNSISKPVYTGTDGRVQIKNSQGYTSNDDLRVKKKSYDTYDEPWPASIAANGRIDVRLKLTRKTCQYTVQRVVYDTLPDGRIRCRAVVEIQYRECPPAGQIYFQMPLAQPLRGYKYEFAYAITRWSPEKQMWAHRPYWRLVPACPWASEPDYPPAACCGCQ